MAKTIIVLVGALVSFACLTPLAATFAALWCLPVVIVVRSDLADFQIPDGATLAIAGLGLLHAIAVSTIARQGPSDAAWQIASSLGQGAGAFAFFWLTGRLYWRASGREGLGFGDVKLAGACGIWLDVADQAAALQVAALAAILVVITSRRRRGLRSAAVPFGAFMAPAAWAVFVFGPLARRFIDPIA